MTLFGGTCRYKAKNAPHVCMGIYLAAATRVWEEKGGVAEGFVGEWMVVGGWRLGGGLCAKS